ncbi:MAG: calcium-binding EGF-like domain-containing protein [Polyangiaceae bacterium]
MASSSEEDNLVGCMSKDSKASRLAFIAAPFVIAFAFATGAGCGLDDTVLAVGLAGTDGGADATFEASTLDASAGETGAPDSGPLPCASSPCLNGGMCTNEVASYSCSCPGGFTGTNCQTKVDNCAGNPCAHGTCVDGTTSYTCTCSTGFTGVNCDACATSYFGYPTCTFCTAAGTCSSHGTCSTTGSCTCNTGFTGASCNACATDYYNYPTCTFCLAANTCGGHGTCSSTATCQCNAGYSGGTCATFSGTYSGNATMPSNGNSSDTVAQFGQVNGTAAFNTNTATNRIVPGVATTLTKLTFGPPAGNIGGRNWTATVMKNGTATTLTCSIAANGNTCTISSNVALNATDAVNIQVIQDQNTGTSRVAAWSIKYTQP